MSWRAAEGAGEGFCGPRCEGERAPCAGALLCGSSRTRRDCRTEFSIFRIAQARSCSQRAGPDRQATPNVTSETRGGFANRIPADLVLEMTFFLFHFLFLTPAQALATKSARFEVPPSPDACHEHDLATDTATAASMLILD
jgi:hypothetical protein